MLDRFEMFSGAISAAYRCLQKLERDEMEKYGYKGAFAQYLIAINRYPDGVTASQLCEMCDKDKAAVSRIVAEMHEKGLIVRDGDNAYRARFRLTDEGAKATRFVIERAEIAARDVGKGLSDEKRQVFYESLALLVANLESVCKDGIPEE